MRALTTGLLAALAAGLVMAPGVSAQDALVAKRDKKLASPFLLKADWITDYDEARAKAKETGKPIFAYFTRSFDP